TVRLRRNRPRRLRCGAGAGARGRLLHTAALAHGPLHLFRLLLHHDAAARPAPVDRHDRAGAAGAARAAVGKGRTVRHPPGSHRMVLAFRGRDVDRPVLFVVYLSMSSVLSEQPIVVENLRKRYGETEAVRGISFAVAAGEVFGLLRPNGAGKT